MGVSLGDLVFRYTENVNKHKFSKLSAGIFLRHDKFALGNSRGFSMAMIFMVLDRPESLMIATPLWYHSGPGLEVDYVQFEIMPLTLRGQIWP